MSTDLSRLYNLLRYHKDVEFGPYAGMSTIMAIQYDIRRWLNNRIDDDTLKTIFNKMGETIKEMGIKESIVPTVELHYSVEETAIPQYITPYTKEYTVGTTTHDIHEKIIWVLRPDNVQIGHITEKTWQTERERNIREEKGHEFGKLLKREFNMIALLTHEYQKTPKGESEWLTLHIDIFYPLGEATLQELKIYSERIAVQEKLAQEKVEETKKEIAKLQKRLSKKSKKKKFFK